MSCQCWTLFHECYGPKSDRLDSRGSKLLCAEAVTAAVWLDWRRTGMYNHILISTDGSEVAQKGVDHGLSLAKSLGARATIITVTERLPIYAFSDTFVP